MGTDDNEDGAPLRVTFRRVQSERVAGENTLAMFCPRRNQVIDVLECAACEHGRGLCFNGSDRETFVRCAFQQDRATAGARDTGGGQVSLASVMSAPAVCVSADDSVADVRALFLARAIGVAPVIDADGCAIGIVGKTDLARGLDPDELLADAPLDPTATQPDARVHDIMSHVVFALHGDADLSRAAALMAYERVHHVVVTTADGRALGIVSALDILRWLAQANGYVCPRAD